MDIKGTGRIDRTRTRARRASPRPRRKAASRSPPANSRAPRASRPPGPIAALDSILTLQGVGDSASGRSKGLARGNQLLDMLDEVRDGLLGGGVPRATLTRLAHAVGQRHDHFSDPQLQGVLDEIELRARVELAKLEQADRAAA